MAGGTVCRRGSRGVAVALLALGVVGVAGCGPGRGDVKGRVTFLGKPVVFGGVVMMGSDDKSVTGNIDAEGNYTVRGVRAGAVRVAVVSPDPASVYADRLKGVKSMLPKRKQDRLAHLPSAPDGAPPFDRSKWFPLPRQYEQVETSGITATIHSGDNTFDIELK
jgi:hypothetical protein